MYLMDEARKIFCLESFLSRGSYIGEGPLKQGGEAGRREIGTKEIHATPGRPDLFNLCGNPC